jgi:YidC/Oxa1 family membrane protein insertase
MMKMQREEGFNPLGGCLPILMQAPIFLSLFHVLRLIGTDKAPALSGQYHWRPDEVSNAGAAKLFGAPIAAAFRTPVDTLEKLGGSQTSTRVVTFVLIVLMCAATFITQKQIMARGGQVLEGQQAMIQKLLLYGMPISLFVSGFLFPLGVLLYWFTNNLWTMGQQFYILHRMPPPGAKKDGDKPAIDAKALAPRPGQKPVNPRARRPAGPAAATPPAVPPAPADEPTASGTAGTAKPASRRGRGASPADPASPATPAAKAAPASKTTPAAKPASKSGPAAKAATEATASNGSGGGVTGKPASSRSRRRGAPVSPDSTAAAGSDDAAATAAEGGPAANPGGLRGWRDAPGSAGVDSADGEVDGTGPAAPDAADGASDASDVAQDAADDSVPPAGGSSSGSASAGGASNAPRPARRPPARRSSTTTRPKKKRR